MGALPETLVTAAYVFACSLPFLVLSTTLCRPMTTQRSHRGIETLFASRSIARLPATLTADPQRGFYQREPQRITAAHLRQLQRDLARLEQSGFVDRSAHGNRVYYRAAAHSALPELRQLMAKTMGVGATLMRALETLGDRVDLAFIYGSLARGDDTSSSDVDLFVVGSATRRALVAALAPGARLVGNH